MKKIVLGGKAKGFLEVLSSHFMVLFATMLISFILPLRISIEEYGKWQLFSLVTSYAGFFALGFNDGIHINYADLDYDQGFFLKFRTFRRFIYILSISMTALTVIAMLLFNSFFESNTLFIYIIAALNIIPVLINGFFAYVNQGTMRFGYYAKANLIEKIVYLVMMFLLLIVGVKNAIYYILLYTAVRYVIIVYNRITSKELYGSPCEPMRNMRSEIKSNFVEGFVLMIAVLCNQSIIVPGRVLIQDQYGLVAFSCYSFAIHTMVIANQISTAMSQVFYPAMKRSKNNDFNDFFKSIDESFTLISAVLLVSYYCVYALIEFVYPAYRPILEYLYCLYPMFIFTSKSAILIINTYKTDADNKQLLINNALGVIINLIAALVAHLVFKSIFAIALFSLIGYVIWYYFCYCKILCQKKIKWSWSIFADAVVVLVFILINAGLNLLGLNWWTTLLVSCGIYCAFLACLFILRRKQCIGIVKKFITYMNK